MRKKIVAGNWKMNKTILDGQKLVSEIIHMVNDEVRQDCEIIVIPPFTHLYCIQHLLSGERVNMGAQNCSSERSGAFTGEISAEMISSVGAKYVLIGHSERRTLFAEKGEQLKKKIDICLESGLTPVYCIGESLQERNAGMHFDVVRQQLTESLFHLGEEAVRKTIIAYEPVWAIGTGVTASPEQAQEMHAYIRKLLADRYGNVSDEISILYGGSCNAENAKSIFSQKDVDGGLIGGASLKSRDFVNIVKSFQ